MQNPIREQIRLDGRWQARRIDGQSVSVFVPGSWAGKRVILRPGESDSITAVEVNGEKLAPEAEEQGWETEPPLQPGQWNTVVIDGELGGARLIASQELHITALEATSNIRSALAVRIRLSGAFEGTSLFHLDFSLTSADGRRVGGMDVVVGNKTRDLTVEMPLTETQRGPHRLKATLCHGDQVVDNARVDIQL